LGATGTGIGAIAGATKAIFWPKQKKIGESFHEKGKFIRSHGEASVKLIAQQELYEISAKMNSLGNEIVKKVESIGGNSDNIKINFSKNENSEIIITVSGATFSYGTKGKEAMDVLDETILREQGELRKIDDRIQAKIKWFMDEHGLKNGEEIVKYFETHPPIQPKEIGYNVATGSGIGLALVLAGVIGIRTARRIGTKVKDSIIARKNRVIARQQKGEPRQKQKIGKAPIMAPAPEPEKKPLQTINRGSSTPLHETPKPSSLPKTDPKNVLFGNRVNSLAKTFGLSRLLMSELEQELVRRKISPSSHEAQALAAEIGKRGRRKSNEVAFREPIKTESSTIAEILFIPEEINSALGRASHAEKSIKKVLESLRSPDFRGAKTLRDGRTKVIKVTKNFRLCFEENPQTKKRIVLFFGNHDQYNTWVNQRVLGRK